MNEKAQKAADALVYYFRLFAAHSVIPWNSDNEAEVRNIVENILDAAEDYTDDAIDSHNDAIASHPNAR